MKSFPHSLAASLGLLVLPVAAAEIPVADVTAASGVNIHFTDAKPGELEMMQAAGFRWARMDFSWQGTERQKGVYDFSAYERLTAALEKAGMHGYFILDYSNALYEPAGSVRSAEGRTAYARWAAAAVAHFKGRGICWEIWNEPNGGFWPPVANAQEYVAMALEASKAIRSAAPEEILVGPATSTVDLPFIEACGKAGLFALWDGVSVHPYRQDGPESVEPDYGKVRTLIARDAPAAKKRIPVLSGEWGYSSAWAGQDPDRQGRMLPRQWLINAACSIPISIWYDWKDDGPDPKEPEHHFGTVEATYHEGGQPVFQPKPAYRAAQTFNKLLVGCGLVRRVSLGSPDRQGMLFADRSGRQVLAAWTTAGGGEQAVKIASDDGEFAVTNHLGDELPKVSASGGTLSFQIDGAPRYVVFPQGNRRLSSATEALAVKLTLLPAAGNELTVELSNLSHKAFRSRLALTDTEGLKLGGKEQEISVAAGSEPQRVSFPLLEKAPHDYRTAVALAVEGSVVSLLESRSYAIPEESLLEGVQVVGEGSPEAGGSFAIATGTGNTTSPVAGSPLAHLNYEFTGGWKYAPVHPGPAAKPFGSAEHAVAAFGMWIEGDGSGMIPRLRVQDANGRVWQPAFPPIDWKGWHYVEARLDADTAHWGGKEPDARREALAPLKWDAVFLLDNPQKNAAKGTISFTAPVVIAR